MYLKATGYRIPNSKIPRNESIRDYPAGWEMLLDLQILQERGMQTANGISARNGPYETTWMTPMR